MIRTTPRILRQREGIVSSSAVPLPTASGFRNDFPTTSGTLEALSGGQSPLVFRNARMNELARLKELYNAAWVPLADTLAKSGHALDAINRAIAGMQISFPQLSAQLRAFPEGQFVGVQRGSDEAVTMLSTLVKIVDSSVHIPSGYNLVTDNRTFSGHIGPDVAVTRAREEGKFAVLFCVSIVVDPSLQGGGFAVETLNHGISVAERLGLIVIPYSRPVRLAAERVKEPGLSLPAFLNRAYGFYRSSEEKTDAKYEDYCTKITALNDSGHRILRLFGGVIHPLEQSILEIISLDPKVAFQRFQLAYGISFRKQYGRDMTIEDFILITQGRHIDPVMNMHMANGARLIRNRGKLLGLFENSRPEDLLAAATNVCLTYTYEPRLLGFRQ